VQPVVLQGEVWGVVRLAHGVEDDRPQPPCHQPFLSQMEGVPLVAQGLELAREDRIVTHDTHPTNRAPRPAKTTMPTVTASYQVTITGPSDLPSAPPHLR